MKTLEQRFEDKLLFVGKDRGRDGEHWVHVRRLYDGSLIVERFFEVPRSEHQERRDDE